MSPAAMSILKALVLPPASPLLLCLLGALLWRARPRLGKGLVTLGIVLLAGLSMPVVGTALLASVEAQPPLTEERMDATVGAIVILGSGLRLGTPDFGGDAIGGATLERVRYGAWLRRKTGLPILVSGGKPQRTEQSEAWHMKRALEGEFGVPVRWAEEASLNTWENALMSARILQPAGIDRVYLVTNAAHMARARQVFEAAGLAVVPAPTGYRATTSAALQVTDFLPRAGGLSRSRDALHEILGRQWYRVRDLLGG